MSLVMTARLRFGQSFALNRSASAVFPEPTGPAIPMRYARVAPSLRIECSPCDTGQTAEKPPERLANNVSTELTGINRAEGNRQAFLCADTKKFRRARPRTLRGSRKHGQSCASLRR